MNNKLILTISLMFLFSLNSFEQCNVNKNERDDGVTVHYTRPDRIGYCEKFVLGLSMQTDGKGYYVVALCAFESTAQKLQGDLLIAFQNKKSSKLHLYKSIITSKEDGTPISMNIFIADENCLKNIASSNLKMEVVQLDNGIYQNVKNMVNADKLKIDFTCLKNRRN